MEHDPAVLAIDAGQTGIKVRRTRPDGGVHEAVLPGVRTDAPLVPQLATVVGEIALESGQPVSVVAAGVSGLTDAAADAAALLDLVGPAGVERVVLAHDSVTSFLGTLGDRRGAVVASGTGVVTLGVGTRRTARVDGWGHIMGDAGSGYWIGREGLDAAMRAYDGRGPATPLLDRLRDRWPDPTGAYIHLQSDPGRVHAVAAFARSVADLAADDPVAAGICRRAADELAHSVVTALDAVAEPDDADPPHVGAIGGVFGSVVVRARFEERMRDLRPDAEIATARGSGVDGAALLPGLGTGHALRVLVGSAQR
ncbi:BadF/BadG/BcrA/BcrD ATPase family protein [Microbacterium awajiense]|uniref:BadF/BadG/BcrA/BcrD ATPase family protein n=1 Tax=Microbacterium awajiense TaxID=415214 RepID=A0ABP7AH00_9MICO